MSEKYNINMKNPAVKRIMQELKEMQNNPSDDYMSLPLEFAIRGPRDTEFEGGIYHGRIQLPADYPLKPPSFMLLTPNGRFETQTKICLSISNYHPEHWQPSWSVRSALVALIAFMPTKPEGAVGSLDYSKEERSALAIKSRAHPPKFGNTDRQKLINEIHEYMLKKATLAPELSSVTDNQDASQPITPEVEDQANAVAVTSGEHLQAEEMVGDAHESHLNPDITPPIARTSAELRPHTEPGVRSPTEPGVRSPTEPGVPNGDVANRDHETRNNLTINRQHTSPDDRGLTLLAVGLSVAIIALLIKKFLKSYWWIGA
ncbi:ubiquitin-conjugating enzyme E2 32 isoform X2 [Cryptomeria japonica]|uniref:ubiquitin-conjugating enzyme E2 32 isoform X2 n=1 Tax=Cryptomeria japonica TaxID=3369 RepID=UPI0025AC913C|nr:ubiquitin-conjugating enzyme E2 32 isoform X2 [Cryptomeria japonica]